jgi:hypothetical protein
MKSSKAGASHTSQGKKPSVGDFYGSGVKASVGRVRSSSMSPSISKKRLKIAPKRVG